MINNEHLDVKLQDIPNNQLLKYFSVSTEVDDPKINLIHCRPSASK